MSKGIKLYLQRHKKLILLAKIAVTIFLCYIITTQIDWSKLAKIPTRLNSPFLYIVIALMIFNITISAFKWKILLSIHKIELGLDLLAGYYFTSMFVSKFLPGTVGGDGYRAYKIFQLTKSKSAAIVPIFIERLTGVMTLIMLGSLGGLISYLYFPERVKKIGLFLSWGLIILCSSVTICIFYKKIAVFFEKKIPINSIQKFFRKLIDYQSNRKKLLKCFFISFLFYTIHFLCRYLLLQAAGVNCSFFALSFVMMISIIAAQIPLSINGIGIMDGSFVFLISAYGVPPEEALVVMLLFRTISLFISFIGIYFFYKSSDSKNSLGAIKNEVEAI